MAYVTRHELEQAFEALEANVVQIMGGVSTLRPVVDGYVTEKDAADYLANSVNTWGQMNKDIFEAIQAELVEIMGEDAEAPEDILGKVNRMLEGVVLMWAAINKYMPEPLPSDASLDVYAQYIHRPTT